MVTAGTDRFCVDMKYVQSMHEDDGAIEKMVPDLGPEDTAHGGTVPESPVISLHNLINGNDTDTDSGSQLIVLKDGDVRCILQVHAMVVAEEIAPEALQEMPMAFSGSCRDCFPDVAVFENEAIPVVTPRSIMKLVEHKKDEMSLKRK